MPQADATPHFGEREVAPPRRQQMAGPMRADGRPFYLMRWQTAARDASQIVCLLRIGLPAPLGNVSQGRRYVQVRRKPGTDVPMTKASGGRPVRQAK